MFLAEPPRTAYDLNFSLAGVPVRIHPFFWLVTLIFGARGDIEPARILIWIGAVVVSILVHEFGHVLAFARYGTPAYIVLHGFGGLAVPAGYGRLGRGASRPWEQIVISAAGPIAGFALAAILLAGIRLAGKQVEIVWGGPFGFLPNFGRFNNDNLTILLYDLLYINIFWGLINLLPVFPLDGGQIARSLFVMNNGHAGESQALWLSTIVAVAAAAYAAIVVRDFGMTLLFGYLAYTSYRALHPGGWGY